MRGVGVDKPNLWTRLLFTDPGGGGALPKHFWVPACLPSHPLQGKDNKPGGVIFFIYVLLANGLSEEGKGNKSGPPEVGILTRPEFLPTPIQKVSKTHPPTQAPPGLTFH